MNAIDTYAAPVISFEADQKSRFGMLAARVGWWSAMAPTAEAVRTASVEFLDLTRGGRVFASDQDEIGAAIAARLV